MIVTASMFSLATFPMDYDSFSERLSILLCVVYHEPTKISDVTNAVKERDAIDPTENMDAVTIIFLK